MTGTDLDFVDVESPEICPYCGCEMEDPNNCEECGDVSSPDEPWWEER